MISRFSARLRFSLLLFLPISLLLAQREITLKNSFIQKYKDRVTIDCTFTVDRAHKSPNPPADDGDLHVAGRAEAIGLPMVAEIMNAASEKSAVDLIHSVEGSEQTLKLSGVWRLWCEHPGKQDHVQGAKLAKPKNTNPDHVFEIHPILEFPGINLLKSLRPIEGFDPYTEDVFDKFDNKQCEIIPNPGKKTTTIVTKKSFYNYVKFTMELTGDEQTVSDGRFVTADVLDSHGNAVAEDIRMVFIKGSDPEKKVSAMKAGDKIKVLGIPRIDLNEVWNRVKNAKKKPGALKYTLPYEMIIVGIYE